MARCTVEAPAPGGCYLAGEDALNRWGLEHRKSETVAGETIWIAPPEYVIAGKLEVRRQGEGEQHLDDVARMLRVSGDLIDRAVLGYWVGRMGLEREWQQALDRLARIQSDRARD